LGIKLAPADNRRVFGLREAEEAVHWKWDWSSRKYAACSAGKISRRSSFTLLQPARTLIAGMPRTSSPNG